MMTTNDLEKNEIGIDNGVKLTGGWRLKGEIV